MTAQLNDAERVEWGVNAQTGVLDTATRDWSALGSCFPVLGQYVALHHGLHR